MAKIAKICQVYLYSGLTANVVETYKCKKLLDDNGIKYTLLHYSDDTQHEPNFKALSTWGFGFEFRKYEFKDFPIIVWRELYDDYEGCLNVAQSSDELAASNLIANKSLVV